MPFTFSHPAVILPLTASKLRLSATGLIIGSLVPDFEYFIRMRDHSRYSHTMAGIFWFDIPLAVLLCFIYHQVVRNSLYDNLPSFLRDRFSRFKKFQWIEYFSKRWLIVIISILIGTLTHLLWDDFTHETKSFIQRQTELSEIMRVGKVNLAGYRFLQFVSSLTGAIVVILTIISLKKEPMEKKSIDYRYWMLFTYIFFGVMSIKYVRGLNIHEYRVVVVCIITGIITALILTPILLKREQQPDFGLSSPKGTEN